MSLSGKMETSLELRTPAAKFYELSKSQNGINLSQATNGKLAGEVVEGQLGKNGCVLSSDAPGGKNMYNKMLVEKVDDENMKFYCKVIEGELLKHYKNINYSVQITPKGEGSVVHWTIEYEKMNKDVSDLKETIDHCAALSKQFDLQLSTNMAVA
ncbi:MLP-like protein 31 [Tripterygium wilfordii]|uniref:MLP-like protein 31 n=1 Tax=Tripterygium wilfordii TaxID=458696 RepID=UPI0018F805A5|nr:MLP-like protein 31 [Tripterygium wilfordii]